jgi:anti-sigma-K factor RskA
MAPRSDVAQPNWIQRWFGVRTFAPLAAGLVLGVALSVIGPGLVDGGVADSSETQLPESYVGVLAGADGRAGLIVSSRRHGKVMDIKQIQPAAVLPGQALFLWVIESDGTTRAIGAVPQGRFVQVTLPKTSEQLFAKATELAVSIEPAGVAPAAPTQPFVYRGLCGKLWRVVAPQK